MEQNDKKYPEGHFVGMWMGIGIAIFSGFGVPSKWILGMDSSSGFPTSIVLAQ